MVDPSLKIVQEATTSQSEQLEQKRLLELRKEADKLRLDIENLHKEKLEAIRELRKKEIALNGLLRTLGLVQKTELARDDDMFRYESQRNPHLNMQLKEANERLLLAAINAEFLTEEANKNLNDVIRNSQLDPLTGIPNRTLMLDRLEGAIANAKRRKSRIGVIFLDVDNFKKINDGLGHLVGDKVVQFVARQIESVIRDSDTVIRYGGDEFVVILSDLVHIEDAKVIAEKILTAIAQPFKADENEIFLSSSLGIALYPDNADTPAQLIESADAAMYSAKRKQPGTVEFFHGKNT